MYTKLSYHIVSLPQLSEFTFDARMLGGYSSTATYQFCSDQFQTTRYQLYTRITVSAPWQQFIILYAYDQSTCVPAGRILRIVVRDKATTYMIPANRMLEPKARNAAKLSMPSRTNAPTVSTKAETSKQQHLHCPDTKLCNLFYAWSLKLTISKSLFKLHSKHPTIM